MRATTTEPSPSQSWAEASRCNADAFNRYALGGPAGGCMRGVLYALLLCSLAVAQDRVPGPGPEFNRGARERGSFYLNGLGYQFLQGTNYTVVASAIPTLNGRYFGVKVHVFNRG